MDITRKTGIADKIEKRCEHILIRLRQKFGWHLSGERLERLRKIYVGKSEEDIFCRYYGKLCEWSVAVLLLGVAVSVLVLAFPKSEGLLLDNRLRKEAPTGKESSAKLKVYSDKYEKEITVKIPRQTYTKEQIHAHFRAIKQRIEQTYLGENRSSEQIVKPLVLTTHFPNSAIDVSWDVGNSDLIQKDGTISSKHRSVSKQVTIRAILSYGKEKEVWAKQLTILPLKKTKQTRFWEQWEAMLAMNKERESSASILSLPKEVNGQIVHYAEQEETSYIGILFVFVLLFFLPILMERNVREQLSKREEQLQMDYPDFVERIVLLMGAGLTVRGAWQKIVSEYMASREVNGVKRYVYEEMQVALTEMENGLSEIRAYELFGKRTGLLSYMKLTTLLVQNLKKGSADLLQQLEYEVEDAFRVRKENAKTLGEKAGTKLLLPMALMLGIVFALILYAAFQGM